MTVTSAIEIQRLTKLYPRAGSAPVKSIDDITLSVPRGRLLGLLGANGAGKTTTIKMICGLVIPESGRIWIEGDDAIRSRRRVMRRVGVVLEGTRNLYWRLTAWENVLYFGRLRGCSGARLAERAEALLSDFGLWPRRHDPVQRLSRGMQQQVAIACAVVADPSVILLDEPTLGLDAEAARTLKTWIAALTRVHHKTVVLTTHQLALAQELCDHVAIMSRGRIIAHRPMSELLDLSRVGSYRIRVKGRLAAPLDSRFDGWDVSAEEDETLLRGQVTGDGELYAMLGELRRRQAALVAVTPEEIDLEEVYLRLIASDRLAAC